MGALFCAVRRKKLATGLSLNNQGGLKFVCLCLCLFSGVCRMSRSGFSPMWLPALQYSCPILIPRMVLVSHSPKNSNKADVKDKSQSMEMMNLCVSIDFLLIVKVCEHL